MDTQTYVRLALKFFLVVLGTLLALRGNDKYGAAGMSAGFHIEKSKAGAPTEELEGYRLAALAMFTKGNLYLFAAAVCLFFGGEV